jgi:hypothetical protein
MRLEWVEAGSLTDNPGNWRKHPAAQMAALKELIRDKEIGWAGALLYNEKTGRLIDGHARRKAVDAKTPVPVLIGSWSEEAEKKILLTLDPLASLAVPDADALQALLDEVPLDTKALQGLGDNLLEQLEAIESSRNGDELRSRGGGGGDGGAGGEGIEEQFKIVIECRNENHQRQLSRRFEKEGLKFNLLVA